MGNNKRDIALPTIIAVLLILILFVCQFTSPSFHLFGDNKQSTYQQVLELVKNKYVDPVNLDSLDSSAVEELLETLDPHSNYLSPSEVAASTELLKGHFQTIEQMREYFLNHHLPRATENLQRRYLSATVLHFLCSDD